MPVTFSCGGVRQGTNVARVFVGNDWLQVSASSSSLNPQTATIAAWVYITDIPTFLNFDTLWGVTGPQLFFYLVGQSGGYFNSTIHLVGGYQVGGSTQINGSTWTHVAGTISSSGTVLTLYTNGVLDASTSGNVYSPSAGACLIGTDSTVGGDAFLGYITDVGVWNTNLSTTQISHLAAGRRGNNVGANANLVGYWPMLNQSPEPDQSGNSNNGVINGTMNSVTGPPQLDPF